MDGMIDIQDASLLRVTRVRDWSLCFDYGNDHYLIHGTSEVGEGQWQDLYKRTLDPNGKYTLRYVKNTWHGGEYVVKDYIKEQKGKTIVYSLVDKEYFAYKLTEMGFATGKYVKKVEMDKKKKELAQLKLELQECNEKIDKLERFIGGLTCD